MPIFKKEEYLVTIHKPDYLTAMIVSTKEEALEIKERFNKEVGFKVEAWQKIQEKEDE